LRPLCSRQTPPASAAAGFRRRRAPQFDAIERALRSADLLLQTGGFGAIVLDLAGVSAEQAMRIELSTWHRYRVAAEKMQSCFLLLSRRPCAKSASELQLRLRPAEAVEQEGTVFCGIVPQLAVERQRGGTAESNVQPMRKPVAGTASWQSRTFWAGAR
jgi:hypothetical protein